MGKMAIIYQHSWVRVRLCDNIIRYDKDGAPNVDIYI